MNIKEFKPHLDYQITAKHSKKALDVSLYGRGGLKDGDEIYQWEWHGGDNQIFRIIQAPKDTFPWAVILCRFKGQEGDNAIEKFFRELFTIGSGGMVEYWQDVSLGSIDVSTSQVFGELLSNLVFEHKSSSGLFV